MSDNLQPILRAVQEFDISVSRATGTQRGVVVMLLERVTNDSC